MRPLLRRVRQLHRLAVLDAVASAGDYTSAARQLEVSQPAVSRHMAAFARDLGVELVERQGRSVVLTDAGRRLADAVEGAFAELERALADIDETVHALVFAVQPAMATSWIVPMLDQLEAAARTEIRLRIFERSDELDFSRWDMAIVPGTGAWAGWESTMLFREAVRPFAAPSLAAELGLDERTEPRELLKHRLLHMDDAGRPNMTWTEWCREAGVDGVPPRPRLLYNSYPTVIQEALAGNGIALGWQHLLSDLVERGLLVPVGPIVRREQGGHHVCWRAGAGRERQQAILACLEREILETSAPFEAGPDA